jgi:hypothetical protein
MDLGTKSKNGPEPATVKPQEKSKVNYPSFNLNDEKATAFLKESDAEVGDTFTATVTLEVTGIRDDQYGKSVTLDVRSMDDISEGEGGEDEDAEEKDEADAEEKPAKVNKAVRKMMKE